MIICRPTAIADLAFVLAAENDPENAPFVGQWSQERHQQAIADANEAHLIIAHSDDGRPLGYCILQGITDPHGVIQIRRLVITEKGKGYGRIVLAQIQDLAFQTYGAHRLWLDVKTNNPRAQHLYTQSGFTYEGCLRECLKTNQGYLSLKLMSMLRQEYECRFQLATTNREPLRDDPRNNL